MEDLLLAGLVPKWRLGDLCKTKFRGAQVKRESTLSGVAPYTPMPIPMPQFGFRPPAQDHQGLVGEGGMEWAGLG